VATILSAARAVAGISATSLFRRPHTRRALTVGVVEFIDGGSVAYALALRDATDSARRFRLAGRRGHATAWQGFADLDNPHNSEFVMQFATIGVRRRTARRGTLFPFIGLDRRGFYSHPRRPLEDLNFIAMCHSRL